MHCGSFPSTLIANAYFRKGKGLILTFSIHHTSCVKDFLHSHFLATVVSCLFTGIRNTKSVPDSLA